MRNSPAYGVFPLVRRFAVLLACIAASCLCQNALAQGILTYSFEDDLQGFAANGSGIAPLTLDTIGATDGTQSLKVDLAQNATYVGALAGNLDPSIIGDPPGVHSVSFDLTIPTQFPLEGFVDIFIVFFGVQVGTTEPGLEVSFQTDLDNRKAVGDLAPGTYPLTMEFNSAFHPLDFENFEPRPFNDIFGVEGSGNPIDLIPVGFQITVNKSTQAPWVGYIDNVRFSSAEAPSGDFNVDGVVDGNDFLVWQRGGTTPPLDPGLLAAWKAGFGGGGGAAIVGAVPEPASGLLLLSALVGILATSRSALRLR